MSIAGVNGARKVEEADGKALQVRCGSIRCIIEAALSDDYRVFEKVHHGGACHPKGPPSLYIHRAGRDPQRESSLVPELAFELIDQPHAQHAEQRARALIDGGARRVVGIVLDAGDLREWSPQQQAWLALDPEHPFDDPALAKPVPVATLLQPTQAERDAAEKRNMLRSMRRELRRKLREEAEHAAAQADRERWVKRWNEACIRVIDEVCMELEIAVEDSQRAKIEELTSRDLAQLFVDLIHCRRLSPSLAPWPEDGLDERPASVGRAAFER